MKIVVLRVIGVLGLALYGTVLVFTWSRPVWLEEYAAAYIEREVRASIEAKVPGLNLPERAGSLLPGAERLFEQAKALAERKRANLVDSIHAAFDGALARIRDPSCECRGRLDLERKARGWEKSLVEWTTSGLDDFIQSSYLDAVAKLKLDVRIFALSNLAAFLLLLVGTFVARRSIDALFVPGLLLATSVLVCSYLYVFNQNWLLTLFYGTYVGGVYLFGLALIFGLLCDIVLNEARVIRRIAPHLFGIDVER